MINVIVRNSNPACRTLKKYLEENGASYQERNMTIHPLTVPEIMYLMSKTDDFMQLVSKQSKIYPSFLALVEQEDTTMFQVYQFLEANQQLIRVPISYDEYRMVVGVGDEMASLVPRATRKQSISTLLAQLWKEDLLKRREEGADGIHYPRFKICKRKIRTAYWFKGQKASSV